MKPCIAQSKERSRSVVMAKRRRLISTPKTTLHSLPPELRLRIYEDTFVRRFNAGTFNLGHQSFSKTASFQLVSRDPLPALFAVSRQVRAEAIEAFIRKTLFCYSLGVLFGGNDRDPGKFLTVLDLDVGPIKTTEMHQISFHTDCIYRLPRGSLVNEFTADWHGKVDHGKADVMAHLLHCTDPRGVIDQHPLQAEWLRDYRLGRCLRLNKRQFHPQLVSAHAVIRNITLRSLLEDAMALLARWDCFVAII